MNCRKGQRQGSFRWHPRNNFFPLENKKKLKNRITSCRRGSFSWERENWVATREGGYWGKEVGHLRREIQISSGNGPQRLFSVRAQSSSTFPWDFVSSASVHTSLMTVCWNFLTIQLLGTVLLSDFFSISCLQGIRRCKREVYKLAQNVSLCSLRSLMSFWKYSTFWII